jgi:hypothetical protein
VLFLIDGFGWRFLEKFQQGPFLKQAAREAAITRLTSQFPSTTAAHLTSLHTGLPVGEHAILEWYFYEQKLDALVAPLLFSFAGTPERDTLKPARLKPSSLFPWPSLYQGLKKRGVSTSILQHREYTPSTYSDALFKGARARGYRTFPEALVNLGEALPTAPAPGYFLVYYDRIDAINHEYGPASAQGEAEILSFLLTMEAIFLKSMAANRRKVLFLLTADHGQIEVDPQTTVYLNRGSRFAGVEKFLRPDRNGQPIVPAGSARDFFLYIQPGLLSEARDFLASRLAGQAEVRRVADLAAAGYFGPKTTPDLLRRAGDLVILPHAGETVWWYEKDRFEQRFRGHHGGLTPQEMEIPLIAWEMG